MYFFESPIKIGDVQKEVLVVFSGQLEDQLVDYAYTIEQEFRRFKNRPEEVFFFYPNYLDEELEDIFHDGSQFHRNLVRYGQDIPATVLSFDIRGKLAVVRTHGSSSLLFDLLELQSQFVDRGMYSLARSRKDMVIQKAPSGCVFLKPSNAESEEFIKASELAVGYAENQFVGFCLLSKAPKDREITRIYIDTHSISPFVETLIYYWTRFSNGLCKVATYRSFSSYGGKEKAKPEDSENVWLIISASTSNRLGIEMAEEWGLENDQIITLLSYASTKEDNVGDEILLNISTLSEFAGRRHSHSSLMRVRVWGENFTVEAEKPNQVHIRAEHKTTAVSNLVIPLSDVGLFKLNKNVSAERSEKSIFLESKLVFEKNESFKKWINKIVDWYIPPKVGWLVYSKSDESGSVLGKLVEEQLTCNGVNSFSHVDTHDAHNHISGNDCVVVVVPVTGGGKGLLKLNRNLRISGHTGNRIFISPFVASSSKLAFDQFRKSLTFGPGNMKYLFFSWRNIFLGHQDEENSWSQELKVVEHFDSEFWRSRADVLRKTSDGLNGLIGTPSSAMSNRLEFTKDFAFWRGYEYDPVEVDHEAVYATISSVLQSLREKIYSTYDKDSLFSQVYQHSVIGPDNFSRFTDSLLQSCLWRAANARELDYRSSTQLSQEFASILERLIQENGKGVFNASFDLLMGIAVGRILLERSSLESLIVKARQSYTDSTDARLLLNYIGWKYLEETHEDLESTIVL